MVNETNKYTVITGASSGIGYETAKAFASRGKNVIIIARRKEKLAKLQKEILEKFPTVKVIVKATDLTKSKNVYQLYSELKPYKLDTWVNNAGFGNYGSVAEQSLEKIESILIYQLPLPLCQMFIREIFDGKSPDDLDDETLSTINKFFDNSLNVSETSRQLYIHRNTLVYRLDKLQKTTGLDLRVFDDAITFKIALMVVKYMKYMESKDTY